MIALAVALAGGFGAGLRFLVDDLVQRHHRLRLPLGIVVINVTGSLLLGVLTGIVVRHGGDPGIKLVLGTGFLGGYTTFSTASLEAARMALQDGPTKLGRTLAYAVGMFAASLLAAQVGLMLA